MNGEKIVQSSNLKRFLFQCNGTAVNTDSNGRVLPNAYCLIKLMTERPMNWFVLSILKHTFGVASC